MKSDPAFAMRRKNILRHIDHNGCYYTSSEYTSTGTLAALSSLVSEGLVELSKPLGTWDSWVRRPRNVDPNVGLDT